MTLVDDTTVDPPVPTTPPATSGPFIIVDPVAPSGQSAPVGPPSSGLGMTNPVRGQPSPEPEAAAGVIDERTTSTEAERWLYDTEIRMDQLGFDSANTFGSFVYAGRECPHLVGIYCESCASWEVDMGFLQRTYGTGLVSTEKDRCEKFLEGLCIGICDRVATHHDELARVTEIEVGIEAESEIEIDFGDPLPREILLCALIRGSTLRHLREVVSVTYPQHRRAQLLVGVILPGFLQILYVSNVGNCIEETVGRRRVLASDVASVQTPTTERYQSRAQGSAARSGSRGRFQQSDRLVMSDARQPVHVYATRRRDDRDGPNVIVGTFTIYSVPYIALLDNGSTHSYISRTVSRNLPIPIETTKNALTVMSPVGQSVLVDKVFQRCPLMVQGKIFLPDLMELPLEEFDLILGMDWLTEHRVNLDCESKIATLKTSEGQTVVLIGERWGYLTNASQEEKLIEILRHHKEALGWTIADIKEINPKICMHKILLEENHKPTVDAQRRPWIMHSSNCKCPLLHVMQSK
ncbi:hypothetical protein GQ457_01G021960 [Hibiscus cannabinus]